MTESESNWNVVIRGFLGLTQHRRRWFVNSQMCPLVPFVGMFAIKLSTHGELRASLSAFCDISCVSSSCIRPRSFNAHLSIRSIMRKSIRADSGEKVIMECYWSTKYHRYISCSLDKTRTSAAQNLRLANWKPRLYVFMEAVRVSCKPGVISLV